MRILVIAVFAASLNAFPVFQYISKKKVVEINIPDPIVDVAQIAETANFIQNIETINSVNVNIEITESGKIVEGSEIDREYEKLEGKVKEAKLDNDIKFLASF